MSQVTSKDPTDLEIMMFLDGELDGDDAQAVENWLGKDVDAASKAKALGQISQVVRTSMELEADAAEGRLAGLWSAIDKSINANGVSKESAVAKPSTARSVADQAEDRATDALVAKTGWLSGWQGHVVTAAFVAAAVAILMFVTRPERVVTTVAQPSNGVQHGGTTPEDVKQGGNIPVTFPAVLESQDPEVEELEVYNGSGVIMTIPGDALDSGSDNGSSAVIWISNDTDVVEDPV